MNKSLEYIRSRIANEETSFSDRNMETAIVVPFTRFVKLKEKEAVDAFYDITLDDNRYAKLISHLIYDPDAEFEYFTSSVSTHDGTLLFVTETIKECINNILQLQTYNITKGFPKNLDGAEITFTIGDIVVVNECDPKFAPADKPWMQERTTVMIPLIYNYKERC